MNEKSLPTKVDIETVIEKIDLGLETIKDIVRADDYDISVSNYLLEYYIRITLDGIYLFQKMTGTSAFDI